MATVKICDRCQAQFNKGEMFLSLATRTEEVRASYHKYTKKEIDSCFFNRYRFFVEDVDLCWNCLDELQKWFDEGSVSNDS